MPLLKLLSKSPLTLRGGILLLVLGFFLQGAVIRESDVVATMVVCLLTVLVLLLGAVIAIKGRALRRLLEVEIIPPVDGFFGGERNEAAVRLAPFGVPPLTVLSLELIFEEEGAESPILCFHGRSTAPRVLSHTMTFPHRGNWNVAHARFCLEDRFGLCRFFWEGELVESSQTLLVQPVHVEGKEFPVVSSSERVGDLATSTNEKVGDPFDLKPYHPADGMRKILWKVYAKSGQLLSRTPEASMTPEGQVVVFCAADRADDRLAAYCVHYAAQLEQHGLVVYAGCEGMDEENPIARSAAQLNDLLIEYVWNTPERGERENHTEEIDKLLLEVSQHSQFSKITKVVVFFSASRLASEGGSDALIAYGAELVRQGVEPVIFVLDREELPSEPVEEEGFIKKGILSLLVIAPEDKAENRSRERFLGALAQCGARSWEVVS